ncbi:MAG: hypothetical protein AMJ81_00940 [Phycisphaerae bacterium SM23_33]|nr:MAG: hypothetical protein AMJ81_00940 [Phycisphaerae bacterium SM23_33]
MTLDSIQQLRLSLAVLRAQLGDQAGFDELWEMYNLRLSCFVRLITNPTVEVDDVLQDVWLVVCQRIGTLRSPAAFPAWLYSVARHRAYRTHSRRVRDEKLMQKLNQGTLQSPDSVTQEHMLLEDVALMRKCLDQIPPQHREVLLLRFLEDMSYQEIADVIRCSLGTVRSRIHYAKAALLKAMERKRYEHQ